MHSDVAATTPIRLLLRNGARVVRISVSILAHRCMSQVRRLAAYLYGLELGRSEQGAIPPCGCEMRLLMIFASRPGRQSIRRPANQIHVIFQRAYVK